MSSLSDLGYDGFGIRTIPFYRRQTPSETRVTAQPGALISDSVYIGSGDDVFKADKEGIYLGNSEFASAPFRVNMSGDAVLNSVQITATKITTTPTEGEASTLRVTMADGTQIFDVDTTNGWVNIGPNQPTFNQDPLVPLYITKESDSYIAINLQNPSSGEYASADFGCLNDYPTNETSLSGLIDLGIASTTFADPDFAVYGANACYLWAGDISDLFLGTAKADGSIHFFNGGTDSLDYRNVEINSSGVLIPKKTDTAGEPAYAEGGMYYNTTTHTLMVAGETAWEPVVVGSGTSKITVSSTEPADPSVGDLWVDIVGTSPSPSISPSVSPSS
jgi:hypothetical protein